MLPLAGIGASTAGISVAGLIARQHPDMRIVNRAPVGLKLADIAHQLVSPQRFDLILIPILGGGKDAIRLTAGAALQASVGRALQLASDPASTVVLMPAENVGSIPFFPQPLAWLMRKPSIVLHAIARSSAANVSAIYVTATRKGMKTRLCAMLSGSMPLTDYTQAMTVTSFGLAHCRIKQRCRSGWRLCPDDSAVLHLCNCGMALCRFVTSSATG